jgi:PAS domain S-box-containing protein
VQQGRVREVAAQGDDEIAEVARALGTSLRELEDYERKRAGKISEMQNVLHSLMDRLDEAVLVVGDDRKIDYISRGCAALLGKKMHNLRNERFDEVVFAPALHAAVEQAFLGDLAEGEVPVSLEAEDGRVTPLKAQLGLVSDREGAIARVLAVMHP